MKVLSIVVPCFNEEETLPIFQNEINKVANIFKTLDVELEIIYIDDGSKDRTLEIIKNLRFNDKKIKFLSFSRNFGKEAAILAGLEKSKGDFVVLMDADMQDPPSYLVNMYKAVSENGYDCAATRRATRKGEPKIRSFFARLFYKLINKISNIEFIDGARDFRLMTRQVVNAILEIKEYNRFTKGIASWVGFETKWFEYENIERSAGTTKWSFWKLFLYSIDGIIAFSTTPLIISMVLGLLFFFLSFVFIIFIIIRTLAFGDPVEGWPSLAVMILFIGGIQLFCTGILGQYLSKTYMETKNRPLYILKEYQLTNDEIEDK